MRWFKGAAALAAVCLLAGCGAAPAGVEDLLRAPQLDGQQNEVEKALRDYIEGSRKHVIPQEGHERALFYSTQNRRISVSAVENLVKKYSRQVTPLKKITPHKLRSTYGTALYRETGDIYLVADVLGHADVNTTKKHYAKLSDARRRAASKAVILREKID